MPEIPLPDPRVLFEHDKPKETRVSNFADQFKEFFDRIRWLLFLPLSWFFTFSHAAVSIAIQIWVRSLNLLRSTIYIEDLSRVYRPSLRGSQLTSTSGKSVPNFLGCPRCGGLCMPCSPTGSLSPNFLFLTFLATLYSDGQTETFRAWKSTWLRSGMAAMCLLRLLVR